MMRKDSLKAIMNTVKVVASCDWMLETENPGIKLHKYAEERLVVKTTVCFVNIVFKDCDTYLTCLTFT